MSATQVSDEARVVMDMALKLTGQTMDPLLSELIAEDAKDSRGNLLKKAFKKRGLNLPDEILSEIFTKVNEKPGVTYRQKRPMNPQAAYVKFVSDNHRELGRDKGLGAVRSRENDTKAKNLAREFLMSNEVSRWSSRESGNLWNDLAIYYNKVRDKTQDTSVVRRDKTTGYVRNPSTGRMNKIENLSAKQAQKLKVFKRKKCGPDGYVDQFLCYWGLAGDGVCKRCRVSSLPPDERNLSVPFWSNKKPQARGLRPRGRSLMSRSAP